MRPILYVQGFQPACLSRPHLQHASHFISPAAQDMLLEVPRIRHLLIRILSSPASKTFLLSLSFWLLFFTYGKFRYWRDPHSAFFNSDHVYDLKYSAFRESQSDAFIEYVSHPSTMAQKASDHPEICAVIMTARREGKNYLGPVVGTMLEGLTDKERGELLLHVFFVNTDPSIHPSWNETWLRKAADGVWSYDIERLNNETFAHLKEMEEARNFREKGVFDYIYALDACYESKASYLALFEGDIIFADGWLIKTFKALRDIKTAVLREGKFSDWLYLRLFYTETPWRWGPEDFWFNNLYFTLFLGASVTFTLLNGARLFLPSTRKMLDDYSIAVLCIITTPAFIILLFMIGKISLFPPDEIFVYNKLGCCSQALIFPREQVPDLRQRLIEEKEGNTDMIIEWHADETGKDRLSLGKQVVQHVGLTSSRDNAVENTRSVWAFFFEEYDAKRLRREHDALVGILD